MADIAGAPGSIVGDGAQSSYEGAPANGGNGADTGGTTEAQPLLAGKYKDVTALEKAYLELQSKSTRTSQELATIRRGAQASPETMDIPVDMPEDELAAVNFVNKVASAQFSPQLADMMDKVEQMQTDAYLDKLRNEDPESYEIIAPEIVAVLKENTELFNNKNYLELATKIARANKMTELLELTATNARNDAYASRASKQNGSSGGSRSSQRSAGEQSPEQEILSGIMAVKNTSLFG